MMQIRIDMTVERSKMSSAQPGPEFIERTPAAIAQHQIEIGQPRSGDIGNAFAGLESG